MILPAVFSHPNTVSCPVFHHQIVGLIIQYYPKQINSLLIPFPSFSGVRRVPVAEHAAMPVPEGCGVIRSTIGKMPNRLPERGAIADPAAEIGLPCRRKRHIIPLTAHVPE